MLEMMTAGLVVFAILAAGDIVSTLSKAKIPMMFVSLALYLLLIWMGMPTEYPVASNFAMFGLAMFAPLIVNLATIVPLQQFAKQWRAIVVALCGMLVAVLLIITTGYFTFGYEKAIAGCGALCGSVVAAIITTDALQNVGMSALAVIPLAIVVIHEPLGQVIAINALKKYAVQQYPYLKNTAAIPANSSADNTTYPEKKYVLPEAYETPFIALLKLIALGTLGIFLGEKTGLHWAICCLVLGVAAVYVGLLRPKMLDRSASSGITMACIIIFVFTQMNNVTPQVFGNEVIPIITILVVGIIGLALGGLIGGKLIGWRKELSIAVALTALFGFPGNYIITQEVCRTVGATPEEQDALMEELLAPMLIGGYTTVTVGSVLIASILVRFL